MTAPRISAKSNENMDVITSQALANISENFGKFPEILNCRKVYNAMHAYILYNE